MTNQDPTPVSSLPLSGYIAEIQRLSDERDELLRVLKAVKNKTETDPAEGPELRARAEYVYRLVTAAIDRIEGARRDEG